MTQVTILALSTVLAPGGAAWEQLSVSISPRVLGTEKLISNMTANREDEEAAGPASS